MAAGVCLGETKWRTWESDCTFRFHVQEVIVGCFGIYKPIPLRIGMQYVFLCLDAALKSRFLH